MKKAAEAEQMEEDDGVGEEEEEEEVTAVAGDELINGGSSDICKTLMERYSKSSAPQHHHLCASAVAMRSILLEEGLPLTPPAYFAAAITAIRESDHADREAMTALSAFLSLLLPLLPVQSMPPPKAKDAASALVSLLQTPSDSLATPTVRSLVNSLGFLILCVDLDDWSAVKLPLDTLLKFTLDRRPKIRRCAQVSVKKVFDTFKNSIVIKKASKIVLSLHQKYIPLAMDICAINIPDESRSKIHLKSEHIEVLHILNVVKLTVPNLSKKIIIKVLCDICKLLGCQYSLLTKHILRLLEVLLEYLEADVLIPEAENILFALTSYISLSEKNPIDTVLSASTLLKIGLNKLCVAQPSIWIRNLPLIFSSIAGLLDSEADISKCAAVILKELINCHIDRSIFPISANQSVYDRMADTLESKAIKSICNLFKTMLRACSTVPNEHILSVISDLFLRLGDFSYFFMKEIVLKLSEWAVDVDGDSPDVKHIRECLGCAVIAMGPEKILSTIPISFHAENLTCSNAWLIPILKKHVTGSSLHYFMFHIVPLAKSIQDTLNKVTKSVKKSANLKDLSSCVNGLWDLLAAFCHYPTDTSQNFDSLAKLLVVVLQDDSSMHEIITVSVKELVNENRNVLRANEDANNANQSTGFMVNDPEIISRSAPLHYSKKVASRNIKALASSSMDLFQTLADVFLDSDPEKRAHLKEAIGCLASILGSSNVQNFFVSLLEKFDMKDTVAESKSLVSHVRPANCREQGSKTKNEKYEKQRCIRCIMMELASSFVEGADNDFVNKIFHFIRPSLLATDGVCQCTAYYTLSTILKEHIWFCSAQTDELMDLLLGSKLPVNSTILRARFSSLQFFLVHLLKSNGENINTKAFLILNEIILSLKDSKEEVRKSAYDLLLAISCSLRNSESSNSESPLQQLFTMIIGYFSGSSPHIMSGAVAALSLLIYKDADLCLSVPNLIPSVLVLLHKKASEVTKAVLGFVKVLVSCLHARELKKILSDVVNAILPWSSVSKNHFRSKVRIIFEIMMRKCGTNSIDILVPEKYRAFVKTIEEQRHSKTSSKGTASSDKQPKPVRGKKRRRESLAPPMDKAHLVASTKFWPKKKIKKDNISSTNEHSQNAEGTGRQWMRTANHSNSKDRIQARTRGKGKNKRRHADERATGGGKKRKNGPKNDNTNSSYAAPVSRSARSSESNKRGRVGKPLPKR